MDTTPLRSRIYFVLESHRTGDRLSRLCDIFLVTLIVGNVVAAILETVPRLADSYGGIFVAFEVTSVVIFSIEYLLRIYSATTSARFCRSS